MKKQYYQQSINLSEKLERLDREEQINNHVYKLLEMLKEPQMPDTVREQIQKCINEMHLLRKTQDSSIAQISLGNRK